MSGFFNPAAHGPGIRLGQVVVPAEMSSPVRVETPEQARSSRKAARGWFQANGSIRGRQTVNHKDRGFPDAPNGLKTFRSKIPVAAKVTVTVFLSVLVPVYWRTYGLGNFLWFCDTALILTVAGMWLESSLLIAMCSVGILLPQCLWLADFGSNLLGFHLLGLTSYMFDRHLPLFTRGLSLFHGWLPLLLVWLLVRLGYDKRALSAWTGLAAGLVLVCYFFTPPAGAHLADPNVPININYVYGFNDQRPQTWMNQNLYVILWPGALWLAAFLPTHLALRKIFTTPPPAAGLKRRIRFLQPSEPAFQSLVHKHSIG